MNNRVAQQNQIAGNAKIDSRILMEESLKLPIDQEQSIARIARQINEISDRQDQILCNIRKVEQISSNFQSIGENCYAIRKVLAQTILPQIDANQRQFVRQFIDSMVIFNDLYGAPQKISQFTQNLSLFVANNQNLSRAVIKRSYKAEILIEETVQRYQEQQNKQQFLQKMQQQETQLLQTEIQSLIQKLGPEYTENMIFECNQEESRIVVSSETPFKIQIYLKSMMKSIQKRFGLERLQDNAYLGNIMKLASFYILSDIQPQTFCKLLENIDADSTFCQYLSGLFRRQAHQRIESAIENNILINYRVDPQIFESSLRLSQKFFKNSMNQLIQSNQQLSESLLAFLKLCLNSSQNTLPGYFTAQLCKRKVTLKVFCLKFQNYNRESRANIYLTEKLTLIGEFDSQKENKYSRIEVRRPYFIEQVQYFSQKDQQIQIGELIDIINKIFKLSSKLSIRAVIVGDSQKAATKHFLNPNFNNHYVQKKDQKNIEGFRKNTYAFCPIIVYGCQPYYPPTGWLRYALLVAQNAQQFDQKYGKWPIAYHGAPRGSIISILSNGYRSATGFESWSQPVTYFTPSIVYAAMYARPFYSEKIKKWIQIVLQVRINPEIIDKKVTHSLEHKFKDDSDPNFKNRSKQYEWLIKGKTGIAEFAKHKKFKSGYQENLMMKDGVLTYGIMMRLSDKKPSWRNSN